MIDGGTGVDTMTGGPGLDIFKSENSSAIDILVEQQDTDMGLFGNTYITGQALGNDGTTPYAQSAGMYPLENTLATQMLDVEDPGVRQPGYGEQWTAATVENITGIFATAELTGGTGNNTMVVNDVDGKIWVNGVARTVTTWNGEAVLDNGPNSVNTLPEYYVITNVPGSTAGIDIVDSGGGSGTDVLVVFGTNQVDTLTLNSAGTGPAAVGFVQASGDSQMMISMRGIERLEIYTLGGDDHILSNDTAVTTVIDMGAGDDSLIVGTVPLIPDPGNRTLEYPNGVPVADTAHMTNGNTADLFVLGNTGDDYFEVDHNVGLLYLAGDAGDDTFLIQTFLELKQNPDQPDEVTNLVTLFGGEGSNRYTYVQDAPVVINGGSGYNTIIVEGTPLDDTFIVTDTYIAGAGRLVTFTHIQSIEIDSGGGDDTIWVLSTDPNLTVTVNGGSGDDTIHIGGTPPPLVFAPPPFTYTPPPYTVSTTEETTVTNTYTYSNFYVSENLLSWVFFGGLYSNFTNANSIATSLVDQIFGVVPGGNTTATFSGGVAFIDWEFGIFPYIVIDIQNLQITRQSLQYVTVTTTIQPPPVTVTPAPVILAAPPSIGASQVKSKLIILGGDDFETNGDTVIYEDYNNTAPDTGQLVQRTVPRMTETGEQADGTPIFTQDGNLTDSYLSLESTALGIDPGGQTDVQGNPYYGVEMQGIEHIELRLSNAGPANFTIDDTANCSLAGTAQQCTENGGQLPAPTVEIDGGSSSDSFTIAGIGAPTTVIGGGGNDTTTVVSTAGDLSGILSRLIVDGTDALTTTATALTSTTYQSLSDADLVTLFLGTKLMVVQGVNPTGSIDGIPYYAGVWTSVLCFAGSTCPSANGDPAGTIEVEAGVIDQATVNHLTTTFTANGANSVAVDSTISVSDPVSGTLSGMAIRISTGYVTGDTLSVTIAPGVPISATFADGTLTLSGVASLAQYNAVLQSLTFSTTATGAGSGGSRMVTWSVGSGNLVQVNVQEQGVPQKAQPEYGYQATSVTYLHIGPFSIPVVTPEWLDSSGNVTTSNTGVQDITLVGYSQYLSPGPARRSTSTRRATRRPRTRARSTSSPTAPTATVAPTRSTSTRNSSRHSTSTGRT